MLSTLYAVTTMFAGYTETQDKWKEEILQKWEETKKMPRKKKKRIRKELTLDWQIANYNIFDNL